jgi:hypothetical protein
MNFNINGLFNQLKNTMSTFKINSHTYSGSSIVINNGKVIIDGKDVSDQVKGLVINIEGNVGSLSVNICDKLTVTGDVGDIQTQSGDVKVSGSVKGNINTQAGDITCGNIGGDVETQAGDIECATISGKASTMAGDINVKKQ